MTEDWRHGGFGLYVHWPFCEAKCPYCDFNSHVVRSVDHQAWREALVTEVERVAALTPKRVLNSIFFGGGTPSLMPPETVGAVIEAATSLWTPANDLEVTLEANPSSVEAGRFAGYRDGGVNRVSLGVQALNDADLRLLGRLHSVEEVRAAIGIAQAVFERVSFDLIYARQHQSADAWREELSDALAMGTDHLSLYQLTIEPGTAFGDRHARGRLGGLPDEDLSVAHYEITQDLCAAAGMPAYEVSNHARPGSESRHNLIYWRQGDYAGIGPGAHGRLTLNGMRYATTAVRAPVVWLSEPEQRETVELLSPQDVVYEHIIMGMRVSDGIDVARIVPLLDTKAWNGAVRELCELGFVEEASGKVRATVAGRMVLNAVVDRLSDGQ